MLVPLLFSETSVSGVLCLRCSLFPFLCHACPSHRVNVRNPSLGARLMECTSFPRGRLYEEEASLFYWPPIFGHWNSERGVRILFLAFWSNFVEACRFNYYYYYYFFFFFLFFSFMGKKKACDTFTGAG